MELQEKITEAMNKQFVGNYIFTDDELTEIYSKSGELLRKYEYSYGGTIGTNYDSLMFVAMVNAIKGFGDTDESSQEIIYRKLIGNPYGSQKMYLYLTEVIARLGMQKKIMYFEKSSKKYYSTLLAHSLMPKSSTRAFFDLCWEVFVIDFSCYYEKNDENFLILAKALRDKFCKAKMEEDFSFGSNVYSLRAGIKKIAIYNQDILVFLIDKIMNNFDIFYNKCGFIENKDYLNEMYLEWWEDKSSKFGVINNSEKVDKKAICDNRKILPKYIIENDNVCILIPAIRLNDNLYKEPKIQIFSNEKVIYESVMYTKGSGLLMATKSMKINLDDLNDFDLNNISIKITHCNNILYNSKKSLYRELILFKENREVIAQECLPDNYLMYLQSFDLLNHFPKEITRIKKHIYSFNSQENEILQVNKKIIFFGSKKTDRKIWLTGKCREDAIYLLCGKEYKIYDGDISLAVQNDYTIKELGVKINDVTFNLKDFNSNESNNLKYYNLTEIINVNEPTDLVVFNLITGIPIILEHVVKFLNIEIKFDRKFYYDKINTGNVIFKSENYEEIQNFNMENEYVQVNINDGSILMFIPIFKWKIGNKEFNSHNLENLFWYKDINNNTLLEIDYPKNLECKIFASDNTFILNIPNKVNKFCIGNKVYSNLDKFDIIFICAKIENENIPLFDVALKEKFYNKPIFCIENGIMEWNPENCYIGDKDSKFEINLLKNNNVYREYHLSLEKDKQMIGSIEENIYQLKIYKIGKGFLQKKDLLFEDKICIGNEDELKYKNKILYIKNLMLANGEEFTRIRPVYIEKLHFLQKRDGFNLYSGSLYAINKYGYKYYINELANDFGKNEQVNPVRIEIMNNKYCWIVAGFSGVFLDDFLCEFTLDNKKMLSNSDKKTKAIDYYEYEVKNV